MLLVLSTIATELLSRRRTATAGRPPNGWPPALLCMKDEHLLQNRYWLSQPRSRS